MSAVLQFETRRGGLVSIEVEDDEASGLTKKGGVVPAAKGGDDIVRRASAKFEDAMASLKDYAGGLADLVDDLDFTPDQVSVEVGLKLKGSLGFVIAKAGAETDMKVALSCKPKSKTGA